MKFLSRSSLLAASGVAIASLVVFSGNAQADDAGTTFIQVSITDNCVFTDVPAGLNETVASSSAIPTNANTDNIAVECNSPGFTLQARSAGDGALLNTDYPTQYEIPYTVAVGSAPLGVTSGSVTVLTTADQTIANATAYVDDCADGCTIPFTYTLQPSTVPSGIYNDTITYTLTGL